MTAESRHKGSKLMNQEPVSSKIGSHVRGFASAGSSGGSVHRYCSQHNAYSAGWITGVPLLSETEIFFSQQRPHLFWAHLPLYLMTTEAWS